MFIHLKLNRRPASCPSYDSPWKISVSIACSPLSYNLRLDCLDGPIFYNISSFLSIGLISSPPTLRSRFFLEATACCLSVDGLRVATGSYSNLFRVFGVSPTLEASKNPMRNSEQWRRWEWEFF